MHFALCRAGFDSVLSDDIGIPDRRHIVFGSNTLHWWDMQVPDGAILYNLEQVLPGSHVRDALYARSKIVLDTHYYDAGVFEIVRVSYLLANGIFVVSENGADIEESSPFAPAVAFDDYEKCLRYLSRPTERAARIEVGRAIMRSRSATEYIAAAVAALRPGDPAAAEA
ncbi:hypothetical protein ABZ413_14225 [Nocardia rhamnosiphila]|uniref:hypothetical protein n=1 Tax=Nocardia rhamnosiphila TaxID=426716 RepID=UPI0033F445A5